jgi:hypothetical protein
VWEGGENGCVPGKEEEEEPAAEHANGIHDLAGGALSTPAMLLHHVRGHAGDVADEHEDDVRRDTAEPGAEGRVEGGGWRVEGGEGNNRPRVCVREREI